MKSPPPLTSTSEPNTASMTGLSDWSMFSCSSCLGDERGREWVHRLSGYWYTQLCKTQRLANSLYSTCKGLVTYLLDIQHLVNHVVISGRNTSHFNLFPACETSFDILWKVLLICPLHLIWRWLNSEFLCMLLWSKTLTMNLYLFLRLFFKGSCIRSTFLFGGERVNYNKSKLAVHNTEHSTAEEDVEGDMQTMKDT